MLTNNKVYYVRSSSGGSSAKGMMFEFDDTQWGDATGIENINDQRQYDTDAIYDLQGRKIERITRPGIYIINGRKEVVK